MDTGGHRRGGGGAGGVRRAWPPISKGDLTAEILSRVPAKSVVRFRCVCRRWLSLIAEDSFIRSHTLLHPHPSAAGVVLKPLFTAPLQSHSFPGRPSPGLPDPFLSFLSDRVSADGLSIESVRIRSTSNGLILFDTCATPSHPLPPYIVCNPTTKECRGIPRPPIASVGAIALFFDPSSPSHRTLHYSLICISASPAVALKPFPESPPECEFWIYSSITHSWRPSGKTTSLPFLPVKPFMAYTASVSCGGAVHWAGLLQNQLVSFEMESEQLRVTPFPPLPGEELNFRRRKLVRFGEVRGRLHLMETYRRDDHLLHIFEHNEDFEWVLLYHVRLDAFLMMDPVTYNVNFVVADPLCILWQEEEEEGEDGGRISEALLLLRLEGEITSYNLRSKVHRKVSDALCNDFCLHGRKFRQFEVATYAHTLFSP